MSGEAELEKLMTTAPAIDPHAEAPSLESLLASSEFADALAEAKAEVDPEVWPEFTAQVRDDLRRLW